LQPIAEHGHFLPSDSLKKAEFYPREALAGVSLAL
jgi:hypothetical protein